MAITRKSLTTGKWLSRRRSPLSPGAALDLCIMDLLALSDVPLSAYQIAGELQKRAGRNPSVVSIYRSLERLCADLRVEKVETTSGFRLRDTPEAILMICTQCGRVSAVPAPECHAALEKTVKSLGFKSSRIAIETPGLCSDCRTSA